MDLPFKNLIAEIDELESGNIRILLLTKKENYEVGHILLEKYDNCLETHSRIYSETDKGKGYGFCLYYIACQYAEMKGLQLFSSSSPSDFAKRAWRSRRLNEKFRIHDDGETFEVVGRK